MSLATWHHPRDRRFNCGETDCRSCDDCGACCCACGCPPLEPPEDAQEAPGSTNDPEEGCEYPLVRIVDPGGSEEVWCG